MGREEEGTQGRRGRAGKMKKRKKTNDDKPSGGAGIPSHDGPSLRPANVQPAPLSGLPEPDEHTFVFASWLALKPNSLEREDVSGGVAFTYGRTRLTDSRLLYSVGFKAGEWPMWWARCRLWARGMFPLYEEKGKKTLYPLGKGKND
jgi:hypothetical protein